MYGDKKLAGLGLLCLKEVSRCDPRAIAFYLQHLRSEQIKKPKEPQVHKDAKGSNPSIQPLHGEGTCSSPRKGL
jgi:hypothetical protein